jgi:ABC-2 type transport system permease protein/bacitracin transport system permease protein
MLSILGTMLLFDEYKNDTFKELSMAGASRTRLILSKMATLFFCSLAFALVLAICLTVTDLLRGGFGGAAFVRLWQSLPLFAAVGVLVPMAMFPIFFLIVLTRKSYIFSICAALGYIVPISLLPAGLMGIHPLANVKRIIGAYSFDALDLLSDGAANAVLHITPFFCVASLLIVCAVFLGLSIMIINRQEL